MSGLIYNFFALVLASFINLISDCIYKNLGLFKAMVEKGLKLFLHDVYNGFALNFLLVQL